MSGRPAYIINVRRGVEQWQLVGLITRRSLVRIQPPLPEEMAGAISSLLLGLAT